MLVNRPWSEQWWAFCVWVGRRDTSLCALRRNLNEDLENTDLVEKLLQRVIATARIRYFMIDTNLTMVGKKEAEDNLDHNLEQTEFLRK
jgi:hypothetical protein